MYRELFQLREPPFQLTPDPEFLFDSPQHRRAKAYMESTVVLADGFVVLTGDIGCGKTTLIESFVSGLPEDFVLAQISHTRLSPVEFLQTLLVELGFESFRMRKVELLAVLRDFLVEQYVQGKKVLLIIDEAQNLSSKVLEEIRLLSGIESQKEKVLRIILAGQPELGDKLDSPRLEQLTQRVRLRFHISALSKRETRSYIEHRLNIAGADDRQIFDDEAMDLVFRYAGGVPRLINILCDTAMLCASADDRNVIGSELVESAVEELQWVPYADRIRGRERALEATDVHDISGVPLAKLDIMYGEEFVGDQTLPAGKIIIGRTANNDLQIPSKVISRHHAQIVTDLQRCLLEDLNSTNGLYVKSKRVKSRYLRDGDVVLVGEHKLYYRDLRNRESEEDDKDQAAPSEESQDRVGEQELDESGKDSQD